MLIFQHLKIQTLLICLMSLLALSADAEAPRDLLDEFQSFYDSRSTGAAAKAAGTFQTRWDDVRPEAILDRSRDAADLLDRLEAITSAPDDPDLAIMRLILLDDISAARHDLARIPFVGDSGFYSQPPYEASRQRLESVEAAEAWITLVSDTPRYFAENIANMERGLAEGFVAHTDPLATALQQVRAQQVEDVYDSPLFRPVLVFAAKLPADQAEALIDRARPVIEATLSAYDELESFLTDVYTPRGDPSLSSVPGGEEAYLALLAGYSAGAGLSGPEIHALGHAEVRRIRGDMQEIVDQVGFEDGLDKFFAFLRQDPQFYAETPEELLEKAAEMSKRLDGLLPAYFGLLPRLTYRVAPVPAEIAPGYTTGRYGPGDSDRGLSGTYFVNTYALDQRPLYELPALTAHEAVPGHHLQIALAAELEDLPEFRRSYYVTAFGEGWGLYAEKLAGEAGFYRTPYEHFGQLSYEMWRACRLVADTGLHLYGWSRDQAMACFEDNTALSPLNIETEVTRYIGYAGQAVAYKLGELTILRLREEARAALGEAFDIRAFHDHLLSAGAMPLDALEARMRTWVKDQQA